MTKTYDMAKLKHLVENTLLSQREIAKELGMGYSTVFNFIHEYYSKEFIDDRRCRVCSKAQLKRIQQQQQQKGE